MSTSQLVGMRDQRFRNNVLEMAGIANEMDAITLVSNAGTMTRQVGQITTEALVTAAAASQALAITHALAEAGDYVQLTWNGGTNTGGTPIFRAVCTAGTITITIFNKDAAAAFNGTFILAVELRKKLTTITRNQ